jgi:hypothetical protein
MVLIIFHSTIYNYANTETFDFSNSSRLVVMIGFMALWGGVFIILSMVVNVIALLRRSESGVEPKYFWHLFVSGFLYLGVHYVLIIFLGRWSNDFASQRPNMTMIAASLRHLRLTLPSPIKFFDSSSLSSIALNLMVMSLVLFLLFRKDGFRKVLRNLWILGISGTVILLLSVSRVYLYPYFEHARMNLKFLLAFLLGLILAHPYPLLAYLSYGFFGAMLGMLIYHNKMTQLRCLILPAGLFFILYGVIGMSQFEVSVAQVDYFWYFKTNFELGFFILLILALVSVRWRPALLQKLSLFKWFSRVSLSIFLLETFVSELMRILWFAVSPNWVESIPGCVFFGLFNLLLWILIIYFWQKISFKYSFEYFWVKGMHWLGKESTKLDNI